jgi:ABC-type branched-subunit amino acid transport system ATPase component/ABC-type branched-subunit amino acid transport system permease subunit
MNDVVQFVILGFGAGAVYALLGQGIVLIYRGSGIINFSQGAIAMITAFMFYRWHEDAGWGFWPAFCVAILIASAIGALIHLLVMRPLRQRSALARLIATLGILSILDGFATLRWGSQSELVFSAFPRTVWHFDGAGLNLTFGAERVYLLAIATGITVLLFVVYRYTRFGLGVSAAAENEQVASALGWSPDLLATVNWTVGAALAGVAGILIAPILGSGLQVNSITLLVVPALAAVLAGGFSSFPLTLAGGVGIGVLQSELARYGSQLFGTGSQGLSDSLPFFILLVVLVARGQALPLRSHFAERLPRLGSGVFRLKPVIGATVLLAAADVFLFSDNLRGAVLAMILAAVLIVSLVVVTGYAGQISLGQYAIAGIGALLAGRLVSTAGWPLEFALIAGVIAASLIGLVFAIPALRTRGANLAILTLGLGVAVQLMIFGNPSYTGGVEGTPLPSSTFFGINIDPIAHPDRYLIFCLLWLVLVCWMVSNVRRGRVGRRLISLRANERAAASLGISLFETKLYAFALSGAIAGLGGVLIAFQYRAIVYDTFDPLTSINALLQAVIGGIGYVLGALFGSAFTQGAVGELTVKQFAANPTDWLVLTGGVAAILLLIFYADGTAAVVARRFRKRLRMTPEASTTSLDEASTAIAVPPATLEVRGLRLRLGATEVLRGVDLSIMPGGIVALIGPNGAGKTCLIDSVTGFVKPSAGSILLNGLSINGWSAARRARAGLLRSFQSLELFEDLSILDNLRVASDSHSRSDYLSALLRVSKDPLPASAVAAVREFGLADDLGSFPSELAYGKRRLVAIARSLAAHPSVLLLDEPAAGLNDSETLELSALLRRLADVWGIAILVVDHDMGFVLGLCDRVIVLDSGEKIADCPPDEARTDTRVLEAYLGQPAAQPQSDEDAKATGVASRSRECGIGG